MGRLALPEIDEDVIGRFDEVERLLDITYGPRVLRANGDPLSELIGTILSQNTSDINSSRALASLRAQFPTWDEVRDADVHEVARAIRSGGLANIKAPRIQAVLKSVSRHHPDMDLRFLAAMPLEDAMAWLTSLGGIGPKTAACVLLFSLGRPAMPVDTHVGRVMTRIGIVPDRTSTATKQRILEMLIGLDADRVYAVHVETISHGRQICTSQRPRCPICPLREHCDFARDQTT
jgi:endonuclease III